MNYQPTFSNTRKLLAAADRLLAPTDGIAEHNRMVDTEKYVRTQIRNAARYIADYAHQNGLHALEAELDKAIAALRTAGLQSKEDQLRRSVQAALTRKR
jgi:hypothetical protein